jgi:hypothetical protein
MHVEFIQRNNGPERLVCEAEIDFEGRGPLAGLRLVGFSLWRGTDGGLYVTFPSRAFGAGTDRRYFDFLRGQPADVQRFKAYVLEQYHARAGQTDVDEVQP